MTTLRSAMMALVLVSAPATLTAQEDWWDWSLRELSVHIDLGGPSAHRHVPDVIYAPGPRHDVRHPYDRYEDRVRSGARGRGASGRAKARGPAFCRSGAGHPVFGRQWCVEKGFGIGGPAWAPLRWERRYWQDVVPRSPRRRFLGPLGQRELIDVLGPTVYGRLDRERARLGGGYALSGRWIRPHGSSLVLQIRSGPVAVAELVDFGADGWIDVVLVAGP